LRAKDLYTLPTSSPDETSCKRNIAVRTSATLSLFAASYIFSICREHRAGDKLGDSSWTRTDAKRVPAKSSDIRSEFQANGRYIDPHDAPRGQYLLTSDSLSPSDGNRSAQIEIRVTMNLPWRPREAGARGGRGGGRGWRTFGGTLLPLCDTQIALSSRESFTLPLSLSLSLSLPLVRALTRPS